MYRFKASSLTTKIIVALIFGSLFGILARVFADHQIISVFLMDGVFDIVGQVFIAMLKMLVVPLVFVSLVCGVFSLEDVRGLGRVGSKSLFLFIVSTGFAVALALAIASTFKPGLGFDLQSNNANFTTENIPPFKEMVIELFPANPIKSAADGNMIQVIVFSIFFGVGILLAGEQAQWLRQIFTQLNIVIMKIVTLAMAFAPIGVFSLIAKVFFAQGFEAARPLSAYIFTVFFALSLHFLGVYSLFLILFARLNPITFFKKMRPVIMFAFSTASSNATIPVSMKTLTEKLGISKTIASFTVPLGATINMDGTAIMQGVATIFIAQAYGISLQFWDFISIILTATLASVGTAGVPGVGLITLAMVLKQVGLPLEGIGLIIGVDRILDMARTVVNVSGDAVVACIVAHSENDFDKATYHSQQNAS